MSIQERNKMGNHQVKVKYGKFDDGQCAICYSAPHVEKTSTPCGHVFCYQCLKNWIKYNTICPVCVGRFSEIKHGNQLESIANQRFPVRHVSFVMYLFYTVAIALCVVLSLLIIWCHILILVPWPLLHEMEEKYNFPSTTIHIMFVIIYRYTIIELTYLLERDKVYVSLVKYKKRYCKASF